MQASCVDRNGKGDESTLDEQRRNGCYGGERRTDGRETRYCDGNGDDLQRKDREHGIVHVYNEPTGIRLSSDELTSTRI